MIVRVKFKFIRKHALLNPLGRRSRGVLGTLLLAAC